MSKAFKIIVASTKGGVGKTVIAVNLAVALSLAGYRTLLFETDGVNSGISYHLGNVDEESSLRLYKPSGLYYAPASVSESRRVDDRVLELEALLKNAQYDFVVIDTPPADKSIFAMKSDAGLVIVNPDEQSCAAGIITKDLIESSGSKCNVMLNRGFEKPYALSAKEIEEMFGSPLIASIEEEKELYKSLLDHVPNYLTDNARRFNEQIEKVARIYAAMVDEDYANKFDNSKEAVSKAKAEVKKLHA